MNRTKNEILEMAPAKEISRAPSITEIMRKLLKEELMAEIKDELEARIRAKVETEIRPVIEQEVRKEQGPIEADDEPADLADRYFEQHRDDGDLRLGHNHQNGVGA